MLYTDYYTRFSRFCKGNMQNLHTRVPGTTAYDFARTKFPYVSFTISEKAKVLSYFFRIF